MPKSADYWVSCNPHRNVAFDFVRSLAAELSGGHVDLPSFPEIAVRSAEGAGGREILDGTGGRVVGSEPALAARLLRIANSASLNRSGRQVTELRTAISRIGYNMVRSASLSFSMNQMRHDKKLAAFGPYLNDLWERSTNVAAYRLRAGAQLQPRQSRRGHAHRHDARHRQAVHPDPRRRPPGVVRRRCGAERDHRRLARLDRQGDPGELGFPEAMAQAVGDQEEFARDEPSAPDLTDVVAVAILMVSYGTDIAGLEARRCRRTPRPSASA